MIYIILDITNTSKSMNNYGSLPSLIKSEQNRPTTQHLATLRPSSQGFTKRAVTQKNPGFRKQVQ